nr:crinkler 9 [Plasmopara viticola]
MVKLFCALVGVKGNAFSVTIDASESVDDMKNVIKKEKPNQIACDADELQLFLARNGDNTWLNRDGAEAVTLDEHGHPKGFTHMNPLLWIKNPTNFGERFEPNEGEIHVLVVVPEVDQEQWDERRARKKARSLTVFEVERMNSIAATLEIDRWQIDGIALDIRYVEPDFPAWFYVRKETQDIIKIFNDHMEKNLSTVFVGTPGVGKSMLVVLFAFYMALRQQKRVVLFRKLKMEGFSMLYLDGKSEQYWRSNKASLSDLDELRGQDFELCLDGLMHKDVADNFAALASFNLLATSVLYPMKDDDLPVLRQCLVPFWSKSDLNKIGARMSWTEHDIKERYYFSGGNLRDFLSGTNATRLAINQAIAVVRKYPAEVLNTQYGLASVRQVDRLRMTKIRLHDKTSNLIKYLDCGEWFCVITSEYALRQLGKIVAPSYCEELWSKGRMLGDDGLMEIAFENYVHAMARDGQKLELQVRTYDRIKKNQHTYAALKFEANSYLYAGTDAAECDSIMQQKLADVDYWYPCTRCLETIDSVAKLNMGGEHNVVGLIQITKSDNHKINLGTLDKYVKLFPAGARYIALVPDNETSDKFRLAPADPRTQVPLYVAYVATWSS